MFCFALSLHYGMIYSMIHRTVCIYPRIGLGYLSDQSSEYTGHLASQSSVCLGHVMRQDTANLSTVPPGPGRKVTIMYVCYALCVFGSGKRQTPDVR